MPGSASARCTATARPGWPCSRAFTATRSTSSSAGARDLSTVEDAGAALHTWLEVFRDYAATKRVLFQELVDAIGRDSELLTHSRDVMTRSAESVLTRAQEAGEVRSDIDVNDMLRLVGGCTMMPGSTPEQRDRILGVVHDGLRVRPGN